MTNTRKEHLPAGDHFGRYCDQREELSQFSSYYLKMERKKIMPVFNA